MRSKASSYQLNGASFPLTKLGKTNDMNLGAKSVRHGTRPQQRLRLSRCVHKGLFTM